MKLRTDLRPRFAAIPLLAGALVIAACSGDEAADAPARDVPGAVAVGSTPVDSADPAIAGEAGDTANVPRPAAEDAAGEAPAPDGGVTTPAPAGAGDPAAERPAPSEAADAPSGAGATAESQETVEGVLRATAGRYEDVRALQADFRQQLTNTLLGRTTRSAGTLFQRQPDRFLMRFSDPAGDVIVSDGEYFWLYYPSADAKQVIRSTRGAGGLDLRSQFVGDPVRRFEATSHGRETVRGRETHVITLVPREPVGYRRLKVWIDAGDHLVRRFELTEENGNVRLFDLTDLRVNPDLPDDLFRFDPPAGAVVVTR